MLADTISMVEDDLHDTDRTEFRTMFITKRAAMQLLRTAKFYETLQQAAAQHGTTIEGEVSGFIDDDQRRTLLRLDHEIGASAK